MDFSIRFWDKIANEAVVQFYSSKFVCPTSAQDLHEEFKHALKDVNKLNMLRVSMDGPIVDWVLYDELCKHRENEELPKLINIGSYGVHMRCFTQFGTIYAILKT